MHPVLAVVALILWGLSQLAFAHPPTDQQALTSALLTAPKNIFDEIISYLKVEDFLRLRTVSNSVKTRINSAVLTQAPHLKSEDTDLVLCSYKHFQSLQSFVPISFARITIRPCKYFWQEDDILKILSDPVIRNQIVSLRVEQSATALNSDIVSAISTLPGLKRLSFPKNHPLTVEELVRLSALKNLQFLDVYVASISDIFPLLTPDDTQNSHLLPNLIGLSLKCNGMSRTEVSTFAAILARYPNLGKLQEFDLFPYSSDVLSPILTSLTGAPHLKVLDVYATYPFTADELTLLASFPKLEELGVQVNSIDDFLPLLSSNANQTQYLSKLTKLSLGVPYISEKEAADRFSAALANFSNLTNLKEFQIASFNKTKFGRPILKALMGASKLQLLTLYGLSLDNHTDLLRNLFAQMPHLVNLGIVNSDFQNSLLDGLFLKNLEVLRTPARSLSNKLGTETLVGFIKNNPQLKQITLFNDKQFDKIRSSLDPERARTLLLKEVY
jgi:hypothetical protein